MALTATLDPFSSATNGTSYTTASKTPTSGGLYLVFVFGRLNTSGTQATATLSGTNGWNTTWTRITGCQMKYTFAGSDIAGGDVFWGIAASGTAGTLTGGFGAVTQSCGYVNPILIGGGPDTTSPIGVTGQANSGGATVGSISCTLTGTPASTSMVVALGACDRAASTGVAGTSYTLLGTKQAPETGFVQFETDTTPINATCAMTFSGGNDIAGIQGVEIKAASVAVTNTITTVGGRGIIQAIYPTATG